MTPHHCVPAAGPLRGSVAVPGDKSLSHRFAFLAPLAAGESRARGWLEAADTLSSLAAVHALGAAVVRRDDGTLIVAPGTFPAPGAAGPAASEIAVDCGNSGTTARLLLGLLAGRRVRARLDGDASLRSRPMARVVEPLRAMGARIDYLEREDRLPLLVEGRPLRGLAYRLPVPSAQVKSALLLAGLTAAGPVTLSGCRGSRDHTERLLAAMGAPVAGRGGSDRVAVRPTEAPLRPLELHVPGDPSSAAFLHAAALLVPGSRVTVTGMLLNSTRTGYLEVLRRMGAEPAVRARPAGAEPWGDVTVSHAILRPFTVAGDQIPTLVDELPVLAVLAAVAGGVSRIRDAAELRVKESDRIALTAAGLRALGVTVTEHPGGLDIHGDPRRAWPETPVPVTTGGDHRIAMAFAVLALATRAGVVLDDPACVGVSFPDVFAVLDGLQGE